MILTKVRTNGQEIYDGQHEDEFPDYNIKGIAGVRVKLSGHVLTLSSVQSGFAAFDSGMYARGLIKNFSASSAARMRRYLRESVAEYRVFITLTYPAECGYDGAKSKRDLSVFLKRYKRKAEAGSVQGERFSAFWFLEFQKRGSIHFHIFGTHFIHKLELSRLWYEVCGTENSYHLRCGTNVKQIRSGRHGICAYAAKYAAKHEQKSPPSEMGWIGRFWGVCGLREKVAADIIIYPTIGTELPFKAAVEKLQNYIEDAVFNRKASYICTENTYIKAIYFSDKETIRVIRGYLVRLSAQFQRTHMIVAGVKSNLHELLEDLSV